MFEFYGPKAASGSYFMKEEKILLKLERKKTLVIRVSWRKVEKSMQIGQ